MSLDITLYGSKATRVCGECNSEVEYTPCLYSGNITHNLNKMAAEAGIYEALWHPELAKLTQASQLIEPLEEGLAKLKAAPEHFTKFNAPNGWGLYEHFVPFVEEVLQACKDYPNATVHTSI